jgi:hypothetical protein
MESSEKPDDRSTSIPIALSNYSARKRTHDRSEIVLIAVTPKRRRGGRDT